jgi:hypothetical protein
VSFTILEATIVLLDNAEELAEHILRKDTFRLLGGVIRQQTAKEKNASVTAHHACDRSIVKVRVVSDAVLKATDSLFGQHVHGEDAVLVSAVMEVLKQCHVHRRGITSDIEVVARERCIGLEPVVGTLETPRFACPLISLVSNERRGYEHVPTRPKRLPRMLLEPAVEPPMENPGLRDSGLPVQTVPMTPSIRESSKPMPMTLAFILVTNYLNVYDCTHTLIDGCNNFCEASNTTASNVTMVCQGIESGTWSALVVFFWCLKGVFSSDIDGLGSIDNEALLLLELVYRPDGCMESFVCKAVEMSIIKSREGGDEKVGRGQTNECGSESHGEGLWCSIGMGVDA